MTTADLTGIADPFIIADPDGIVLDVVDPGGLVFGDVPADLWTAFPDAPQVAEALAIGGSHRVRATVRRPDGTPCASDVSLVPIGEGRVLVLVQLLRAEALLEETGRVLDVAFQTAPIGMAVYDTDGRFIRANEALCRLLGQPAKALIGMRDVLLTHPDDRKADIEAAWQVLNGERHAFQTEKRFLRPGGGVVWVIANLTFVRDEAGVPLAWLGQFTDITARKTQEGELQRLADSDPLTGLASRRKVMEQAQAMVDRAATGGTGVLLMIDLDDFKAVNDADGHVAGDAMLVDIAHAVRTAVERRNGAACLGRLGGDEFVIVWPALSQSAVEGVVEEIRLVVDRVSGGRVGASIGAQSVQGHASVASLLGAADAAMYADKQGHRDSQR